MRNKMLAAILFIAFAVRTLAVFILGRHITPELWEYDVLAVNILNGKGYVIENLNTYYKSLGYPLYAYFSAFIHLVTGKNYFILALLNAFMSVAIVYLVYCIGKKMANKKVGLLSAVLVALHPGLIVYATKIHELTLIVLFVCLIFWLIISTDLRKLRNNVMIGGLIGIGVLARPTMVFFLPVYIIFHALSLGSIKKAVNNFFPVIIAAVLVLTPWTARNYLIHKRFIFITTSSAEHFWRGNNISASGGSLTADKKGIIEAAPKGFKDKLYSLNEIQQYDYFYGQAFRYIKSDVPHFIKMIGKKFFYFWWFSPQAGILYAGTWKVIYQWYYGALMAMFTAGLIMSARSKKINKPVVISLAIFCIFASLLHSLYYVELRHRWGIEPFIIIIASYGMQGVFERLMKWRRVSNSSSMVFASG